MTKFSLYLLLACIACGGHAAASPYMQLGGSGTVSVGIVTLCSKAEWVCKAGAPTTVDLTDATKKLLESVSLRVNTSIRYVSDPPGQDIWNVNVSQGDCEEYVLAKQFALEKAGIPVGALHIAFAYTQRGNPHAVLVAHTSLGDFVLDNLTSQVRRWDTVPYRWVSIIITENPLSWRKIL